MEPKEKAEILVAKFIKHSRAEKEIKPIQSAIKCALIAVDEILKNFGTLTEGQTFYTEYRAVKYYEEVKQELEKIKNK